MSELLFPFFFRDSTILLLPCFELAINLHPAFRHVKCLSTPFLEKPGHHQHPAFSYLPEKHLYYQVMFQWQFNSMQIPLSKLKRLISLPLLSHQNSPRDSYLKPHTPYHKITALHLTTLYLLCQCISLC